VFNSSIALFAGSGRSKQDLHGKAQESPGYRKIRRPIARLRLVNEIGSELISGARRPA
jgi:hypothetical protein